MDDNRKTGAGPSATRRVIALYETLSARERAAVRKEILKKAALEETGGGALPPPDDVRVRRTAGSTRLPSKASYEPFSEEVIGYLEDIRKAVDRYLPMDSYASGDENKLDLFRRETINSIEPLEWLLKTYFRYEVRGLHHIPADGRAMIVSNHGILPLDGWFLFYEILRTTGRWPRGLTDWRIYRFPYLRQFFMDMGMVVGAQENGDALMDHEELIFIMPGGSKEAWKSSKYRYRLIWKGRNGFIRLALRNRCPIIPSANVGTDDTYRVFLNGYQTAYRFFRTRKALFPISIPVGIGLLPFPAKMVQYIGEPIHLPYPPEAADDPAIVDECQKLVKGRVYELIDQGLQERSAKE